MTPDLRERHAALARTGPPPGRQWCAAWTDAVDVYLRNALKEADPRGRIAIVAAGGYGRRELCPASDVDVLVLHDRLPDDALRAIVRHVVYPMWDAGLRVGHAVRDVREAAQTDRHGLDAVTALIDARTVAGDTALLQTARDAVLRTLTRRPRTFLEALATADEQRRARAGDAAEVLEPDLRDGAGGLRDVQSLRWSAAALLGEAQLDPLVASGYIGAADRSRLARSYEHLLRIRVATHLASASLEGTGKDVLRLDVQADVARRLGIRANGPADLLRQTFEATRTIDHIHRRAAILIRTDARRGRRRRREGGTAVGTLFELIDGTLRLTASPGRAGPTLLTTTMEAVASTGAVLDRTAADELRHVAEHPADTDWTTRDRDRLLTTLWSGTALVSTFAEVDDTGLLTAVIPEWEPMRARPQRHPIHRFSLDRHSFHTAAALGEIVSTEPWAARTLEGVDRRDALILGALLHDVGKPHGEPHTETGIEVADMIARRIGLDADGRDLVCSIVRQHLLLPDVATRRDTTDPAVVAAVAKTVGDEQLLSCLHLVTAADSLATGPTAWSAWKSALVADLVARVRALLGDTTTTLDDLVPGELLPTTDLEGDETTIRTAVELGAGALVGHDTLHVSGSSRADLLAKVTGVLALHEGSVLTARSRTHADGTVSAGLVVRRPPDATSAWWDLVRDDLDRAARGHLALRARIEHRSGTLHQRSRTRVETPVRVCIETSKDGSIIEVRAEDRIGLLYTIALTAAELEIEITHVKVTTLEHEAIDVFTVRGPEGALGEEHAAEVQLALTAALSA